MTSRLRSRLGLLAVAVALPVILACGAGGSTDQPDRQPVQEQQEPAEEAPAAVEKPAAPEPAAPEPNVPDVPDAPEPDDGGGDAYYKNCAAVRDAGKAPLHEGDPGYSSKLDRDGDGTACE